MKSHSEHYVKAQKVLDNYLKEHKLRKTQERYALLEAAYSFDAPFDIHDMEEQMKDSIYRTSLSTIYNTFILLEKAHLLLRCKPDGRYSKFIANYNTNARQHLICSECGLVRSVAVPRVNRSVQLTKWPRFKAESYTLYVSGICYSCQRKIYKQQITTHDETR
jgi:Fur family ferric uptake transcriptional regulator